MTKYEAKTVMIARFRMLECGANYMGSATQTCQTCNCNDDENHRLNMCPIWKENSLFQSEEKIDFNDIYSCDTNILRNVIPFIQKLWNVKNAHGTMRTA